MKRLARMLPMLLGAAACTSADGSTDAGTDGGDPYLALDPSPFGHHPAIAHPVDFPGDPYEPATTAGLTWTRGADAPYLLWSVVDPDRTGDPASMRFADIVVPGPGGASTTIDYDVGIGGAVAAGMQVLWNIDVTGIEPGFREPGSWLPVDEAAYCRFVETAVARYPAVRAWQIGNEPQLDQGLTDYARFHEITYEAIRRADPTAVVVMAGLAGNMTTGADFEDTGFDAVLDELGGCCVDVFDLHFYGDPLGGTTATAQGERLVGYGDFEDVASFYRARLDARGYTATRLWTTENGTPSGTWDAASVVVTTTEAEQARDLPKRHLVALAAKVDKVFWAFGMSEGFGPWDDDFFDHTGLVYSSHGGRAPTRKLAYWALWQMTRQLDGCQWLNVERLATAVDETRAYRCPLAEGGEVVVAWWDTFRVAGYAAGQTTDLELPWSAPTAVARAAVPTVDSGADVTDPATAFAVTPLTPTSGAVTLTLGADPVYVRSE